MKIETTTIEKGEKADANLRKLLRNHSDRIIHTEEVSTGEQAMGNGSYRQVSKLRIWYYGY